MSHPEGLPELFLDRSLGPVQVPRILRDSGLTLITLTEHYGRPRDQDVPDAEWLELVGSRGWIAFTKDKRIGRLRSQRMAIVKFKVRCFYLTKQNLDASEMADRFLRNLPRIVEECSRPGPLLVAVYSNRIQAVPIVVDS